MEYPFKDLLPLDEVLEREGYYNDWTHLDPEVFYSLTQISEYIKTKGYGVDVRLLISQLAEHFGLKTTQVVDLANLLQQKFENLEGVTQSFSNNINSLVAQMEADKNAVIANATVDSEVILARGGKATLGERLDETTAQLAQTENKTEGFVHVSQFGAVGDYYLPDGSVNPNPTDDTLAILNALSANKRVEFSGKGYLMKSRLILNGHTLTGSYHGDTWGTSQTTSIIFDDMPDVDSCVHVDFTSQIDKILFEHAPWDNTTPEINGLTVDRKSIVNNCGFNAFPGHGALLYRRETGPDKAPYMSQLNNCVFDFNKKHGVVLGNGCNAVTIVQPHARWNGAIAYKKQPSVLGDYDGIYFDGKMDELPQGLNLEPSGNTLIGGNISYNSRYGVNHRYGNDNVHIGGYLEHNLDNDIAIDSSYGLSIVNPMAQNRTPTITTTQTDPLLSSRNLTTYPNNIIVRGRNFGDGTTNKNSLHQSFFISSYLENGPIFTKGNSGRHFIFDKAYGGTGDNQSFVKFTDLIHLNAKNAIFGTDTPNTDKGVWFVAPNDTEGSRIFVALNGTTTSSNLTSFHTVNGVSPSSQGSGLRVPAHSTTSRSINVGGTVNTSGADYAEYMVKSDECGEILKGDIVGIDVNGNLTDRWNEAISFVIKSTNPSFVGGDTWLPDLVEPVEPNKEDETDEEFELTLKEYSDKKTEYDRQVENARQKVDRIAFSGICPVNIYNSNVGDYIIPVQNGERIKGMNITNPTFEEYQKAIGKVISIEKDGRAKIVVKVI